MGASSSRILLYTLANAFLAVVGATTLLVANESNQRLLYFQRRRFDWKEIAQRGVAYGVGLSMLVSGVVRQASMERIFLSKSFHGNDLRSVFASPILPFAISWVVGSVVGVYYTSGSYSDEDDGDDSSIDDDQNSIGDGDHGTLLSTSFVLRPTEDNSIGSEPPADGESISQCNDGIVVQNDIMFTIQNVLDTNNGPNTPYTYTTLPEEQTSNDMMEDDDDDDEDDEDLSIEQQFFDLATDSGESISPQ